VKHVWINSADAARVAGVFLEGGHDGSSRSALGLGGGDFRRMRL